MSSDQGEARRALREVRASLRAHIRKSPTDLSARAQLAESYRSEGYLDQAGRWGLLVAGGSTENERQLFARVVTRTGESTPERVRHLLLVPEGRPIGEFDPDGLFADFSTTLHGESLVSRDLPLRQKETQFDAGEIALMFVVILILGCAIEGIIVFASLLIGTDLATLRTVGLTMGGVTAAGILAGVAYFVVQGVRWARAARQ